VVPLRILYVDNLFDPRAAGNVYQDIDSPPAIRRLAHHLLHRTFIRNIGGDGNGLAALGGNFRDPALSGFGVDLSDDDFRPFAREA
jgi:hypothetical protein